MERKKVSPAKVLDTIQSVCAGSKPLVDIASELGIPPHEFLDVIEPSLNASTRPFSDKLAGPQKLLNLILLHLLGSYRTELLSLRKTLRNIENRQRRLNTPYQG